MTVSKLIPARRLHVYGTAIRAVDIIVYAAVLTSGLLMTAQANEIITRFIPNYSLGWVAWLWTALLLVGGAVGLGGRVSRLWLIEMPGNVAAIFGLLLFVGMSFVAHSYLALLLAVIATAGLVRRWFELQIFASEPGANWRTRLAEAWARKTANTIRHL